jgi:hypothetical protein
MSDWREWLKIGATIGSLFSGAAFLLRKKLAPAPPWSLKEVRSKYPLSADEAIRIADLELNEVRKLYPKEHFTITRYAKELSFGYVVAYGSTQTLTGGGGASLEIGDRAGPYPGNILVDRITRLATVVIPGKTDVNEVERSWRQKNLGTSHPLPDDERRVPEKRKRRS